MSRRTSRRLRNLTIVTGLFLLGLVGVIALVDVPKNTANTAKASEIILSPIATEDILTESERVLLIEKLVYLDPELEILLNSQAGINQDQYNDGEVRITQLYIDQKVTLSELDFGIGILKEKYNLFLQNNSQPAPVEEGKI